MTVSFVVDMWGTATRVVLSGPSTVVANGVSKVQITATVVDRDGNRVKDYSGQLEITKLYDEGAVDLPVTLTTSTAGGVASFTVTASTSSGATDTLKVTDTAGRLTAGTLKITSVEPKPTSIVVKADRDQLSADGSSLANISATLLDQDGQPIVNGSNAITLKIRGPGTWADSTTGDITQFTVNGEVTAGVMSADGQEGTITVTASATGVASGSTTIATHVTGAPTQIQLTADSPNLIADGTEKAYVRLQARVLDSHGYLVTGITGNMSIYLDSTNRDEVAFFNDNVGNVFIAASITSVSTDRGVATFYAGAKGTKLGTVTVSATGGTGSYLTGGSVKLTLVAGAPVAMSFDTLDRSNPDLGNQPVTLSIANQSFPFKVQLTDAAGNPVAQAGIPVKWVVTDAAGNLPGSAGYSNQGTGTVKPTTSTTDSNGQASTTLTLQTYMSDSYVLEAQADLNGDGTVKTARTRTITMTDASVAANIILYLSSTPPALGTNNQLDTRSLRGVSAYVTGGDPVYFVALVTDMNKNPVSNGSTVAFYVNDRYFDSDTTGSAANCSPGIVGVACVTFNGMSGISAGNVVVKAVAVNSPLATPATKSMSIMPGRPSSLGFTGQLWGTSTIRAGSVVPFTIQMLDEAGNLTVADQTYTLQLSSAAGDFRTAASAATLSNGQVTFQRGYSQITVYIALQEAGTQTIWASNVSSPLGSLGYGPFTSDPFVVNAAASVNWSRVSFKNTGGDATVDTISGSTGAVTGYNQLVPKVQVWNGNTLVNEVTVSTSGSFSVSIGEAPSHSAWTVRVFDAYGNFADERTLTAP